MYKVHFVGLAYFHVCTCDERRVLIPDGADGEGEIPAHFCSIFIDNDQLKSTDWWEDEKCEQIVPIKDKFGTPRPFKVWEFRIPSQAEIRFDVQDEKFELVNLEKVLPKLGANSEFYLDTKNPDTIAEVPTHAGKVEAFGFQKVAIVQWSINKHNDPIVITVRTVRDTKTIIVKKGKGKFGTEIVVSNTPDLIEPYQSEASREATKTEDHACGVASTRTAEATDHFHLYRKLNETRKGDKLKAPTDAPLDVKPLLFGHHYLEYLFQKKEVPAPGCIPTCCP